MPPDYKIIKVHYYLLFFNKSSYVIICYLWYLPIFHNSLAPTVWKINICHLVNHDDSRQSGKYFNKFTNICILFSSYMR